MSEFQTRLRVGTGPAMIAATIYDELRLDDLFDAEAAWAPARIRVLQELARRDVPRSAWPESLHWNWAKKAAELTPSRLNAFGDVRIFGIRADDAWQGVLLAQSAGHLTNLAPTGRELVYVEYLESAPWNWEEPTISQEARYRGVGLQLVELAVRWSLDLGFQGRLGLHALPQADDFYRRRCAMTDMGLDTGRYRGMRYFEFSAEQAERFLKGGKT
jgi:GNAT superfamily N-acetyltransferase